ADACGHARLGAANVPLLAFVPGAAVRVDGARPCRRRADLTMAAVADRPAGKAAPRLPLAVLMLGAGALLILVLGGLTLWRLQNAQPSGGTDLGKTPAPNFTLVDQQGQQVSLAQFRGQPVVLTFLYTHCPDACPLIADQIRQATDQLGADGGKVG